MSIEVKVPAAGESITSATIGKWHKQDGEFVRKGEVIATLDTDKVSQELEADAEGILRHDAAEGDDVTIGSVIARIEPGEGAPAAAPAKEEKAAPAAAPANEAKAAAKSESPAPVAQAATPAPAPKVEAPAPIKPDFKLIGTGPSVTSEAPSAPRVEGRVTRQKMTPLRRKIAAHLVNAQQTAAILTTFNEVDMSAVMGLRKELQDGFVAKYGLKLGFMSFFVKAVVDALQSVPQINARVDGNDLIQNHFYDIGVAVGTEKGLVVPVLRDADKKSFAEIEGDIAAYARKAKEGKLGLEDLQGGVFTISNGGVYGSLLSTPILNPPQSGILGMHSIQDRPVAINGKVEIRPMMYLALSYDHRIVDGKEAVTFLIRVKQSIEQPTRLLVGV
jgi:2-oxoglutarate dehydrogenase E2 component (dihydrolipoamide succinyltransferase)